MHGFARIRRDFLSRQCTCVLAITFWSLLVLVLGHVFAGVDLYAQRAIRPASGIAWNVRGVWRAEGWRASIRSGDPIVPGSLLEPSAEEAAHSITILLPDGQRILYECFTAIDCARGFRVPKLYRNPEPFAVEMLARIRAALARRNGVSTSSVDPYLARDEVIAELDANNRVEFGERSASVANTDYFGQSASLPNGDYTGELVPLSPAGARESSMKSSIPLHKHGDSVALQLAGPGVYELIVSDSIKRRRIDVLLAAVRRSPESESGSASGTANARSFQQAHELMQEWDENNQGWPIHDFQRAYLLALVTGAKPQPDARAATLTQTSVVRKQNITAEPEFTPRPGVFPGDTAVRLQCATPGAVIHYTVDNSEPFESSLVYRAPVMVKGTALTIKAFSESPGRKDSAVVTGIFRIQSQ